MRSAIATAKSNRAIGFFVYFSIRTSSWRRQRKTPITISVASAASSGFVFGVRSAWSRSLAYAPSDSTRRRISYAIFREILTVMKLFPKLVGVHQVAEANLFAETFARLQMCTIQKIANGYPGFPFDPN